MREPCRVCRGKGTIDDPKCHGPMAYCDRQGNSWPQMNCPNCQGAGFTGMPDIDIDFLKEAGIKP